MPVAAIEALVLLLTASPSTTISETLDLLATASAQLRRSIPNPISLSAGTDLFQRYLVTTLQRPGHLGPAGDFNLLRQHLLSNSRLFVKRAKAARDKIASFGREFVSDGTTVLTNGGSRVVSALLQRAANEQKGKQSNIRFRVMYVLPSSPSESTEGLSTVRALRAKGVPVATIPESGVAYAMGKADMVIVGAEGVVENGGIISRLGTYQIGLIAKAMKKPFYVVAESYKFVRLYPLGQYDMGIEQKIVDFQTDDTNTNPDSDFEESPRSIDGGPVKTPYVTERREYFDTIPRSATEAEDMTLPEPISHQADAVDFTPPSIISALITESGVLTPSAVSEELIKLWF